ncbi:hypothetical protein CCZ20_26050 [Priestia aryabhattai]|uniref:hypothetical protein n=1 Tax=Priestia aryabhattai TaxID=412384 RepID=UPI000B50C5C1|nr:hypothetical protein [Priestia aryabhattai]OVE34538.1 hypothetical protein CCZ20_26050 [Priestia aryabhattai]
MSRVPRKDYFLITSNVSKDLILAENGLEATKIWFEEKQKEREEEGKRLSHNPNFFSVEKLGTESSVYKRLE